MSDMAQTQTVAGDCGPRSPEPPAEFTRKVAETWENYTKFKSQFEYRGATKAYRNMLFDTLLRRIVILSGSGFGCAGEILYDERGPYLKIAEAGLIDPHSGAGIHGFWEKNFGNKATIRHLDNPLRLDLETPRIVIANDDAPAGPGRYLGIPALSAGRFVGFMIVAGAPKAYTQNSVQSIKPVVGIYAGIIEYLRADAARAALEETRPPAARDVPAIVFNRNMDEGRSVNYIAGDTEAVAGLSASGFSGGDTRGYASLIRAAEREKVADAIARGLKEGGQYDVEYRILRPDGSERCVYERGSAIYDENSNPVSIEACALDVTETAGADTSINAYRERFQALIEAQTRTYLDQSEKAQQAARAKNEFVTNISHELRTPMHAILSYSKMGREDCEQVPPEVLKEYFHKIESAGSRLLSLINNLLDIAKMESGRMELNRVLYDFSAVVEDAKIEAGPLLENKSLTLVVEKLATDMRLIFDKRRMAQVVVNLISNAAKFSPCGSTIRVCLADGCLLNNADALCCSVIDSGAGIPDDELDAVFGKFVQSTKTKTGAGGVGLGLSICREIVEAHGGRIWAEKQPAKGTTLSFMIPKGVPQLAG